jgi:hypothetical protein
MNEKKLAEKVLKVFAKMNDGCRSKDWDYLNGDRISCQKDILNLIKKCEKICQKQK